MEDILALLPAEESLYLTPVVPWEDIFTLALTATRNHTEKAIEAINVQLSALVHRHILPQQAGVFLASLLQVMCSYRQKMDGMATSQVILPGQIVLNLWGVSWSMMEGLTLLGPPNCPVSWLAFSGQVGVCRTHQSSYSGCAYYFSEVRHFLGVWQRETTSGFIWQEVGPA